MRCLDNRGYVGQSKDNLSCHLSNNVLLKSIAFFRAASEHQIIEVLCTGGASKTGEFSEKVPNGL